MYVAAIAISLTLCVVGYVYILKSVHEQLQIQHEINLKLAPDKQFEPTFWGYGTHHKFRQLQRDLLPESPRPRRLRRFTSVGFGLLASGILMLLATLTRMHLT